ncbi:hypothetical protein DOK_02871 [gamma proteobacterium BDW918]|jgi:hypothetical protein|uniref:Uncharacterized protein n=1 Tax=Zhongshania aliphaticivorans TaxID=1470434 RepID=A0A127M445_9GAMM|nr:hypothetical protein [Zhongshania aliphaticivorans]AMO67931.1 hypothetical protein AZF00_06260 [Zhongshania aliphaticivorans]EIF44619.1 hypothetical protein DOK_02871 [gamma proteobacterium BDW918]|tara:strand:+ start:71410 stop:71811 length:402 start_codon:yes stop_codon:yes gene_type:complete
MAIGSWTPEKEKVTLSIDTQWLQQCIALSRSDKLELLPAPFSEEEQQKYAVFMRVAPEQWQAAVANFSNDELVDLIRFFTRAEKLISGWDAGKESPAIWINKALRKRGEKLSRDMLLWIRANTDNRFIPNGGL